MDDTAPISQAAAARALGISGPALANRIKKYGYAVAISMPKRDPHAPRPRRVPGFVQGAPAKAASEPGYQRAYAKRAAYVTDFGLWPERAIGRDPAVNAAEVAAALARRQH